MLVERAYCLAKLLPLQRQQHAVVAVVVAVVVVVVVVVVVAVVLRVSCQCFKTIFA